MLNQLNIHSSLSVNQVEENSPHNDSTNNLQQQKLYLQTAQIIDSQFQRTFSKFSEVKRRNPNHYIRNPTKVHFTTLGNRDYAFEDRAKEDKIQTHNNTLKKIRHDYKSLLPTAPSMTIDSPVKINSISPLKNQYTRNDSFVTLGEDGKNLSTQKNSQMIDTFDLTNVIDDRIKPQSLPRHKNSEFNQYLIKH